MSSKADTPWLWQSIVASLFIEPKRLSSVASLEMRLSEISFNFVIISVDSVPSSSSLKWVARNFFACWIAQTRSSSFPKKKKK